jgi:hypothetical protein
MDADDRRHLPQDDDERQAKRESSQNGFRDEVGHVAKSGDTGGYEVRAGDKY